MSSEPRSCILHIDEAGLIIEEEVKEFNEAVWEKVQNSSKERQLKPNWSSSKYLKLCVNLPASYQSNHGYHTTCYKNFTAVSLDNTSSFSNRSASENNNVVFRRSQSSPVIQSASLFSSCLFCKQERRRSGSTREQTRTCQDKSIEDSIRQAATTLKDSKLLAKISTIDFVAHGVQYHHTCRQKYIYRAAALGKTLDLSDQTNTISIQAKRKQCFEETCKYVHDHVIIGKNPTALSTVYEIYTNKLKDHGGTNDNAFHFGQTLLKRFEGQIKMSKESNKKGNVLLPIEPEVSFESKMSEVALHLRSLIFQQRTLSEDIPYPITFESLSQRNCPVPNQLLSFFTLLLTGSTDSATERTKRHIESIADDCMFTATKGIIKPSKHINLGLTMKTLTGSRKVLDLLNSFGHCLSYHTIEEIETDVAMSVTEKSTHIPDGLLSKPGLATGLAWDNYDHLTETKSGCNTLHDTVGICYQNICFDEFQENPLEDNTTFLPSVTPKRSRKRTFDANSDTQIEPYRKKPKMSKFDFILKTCEEPYNLEQMIHRDHLWIIISSLFPLTPMWLGWNSQVTCDELPLQRIGYMTNISLPPTRHDVVAETLKISQRVAEECNEEYAVVHYDLAIAKPAKQIQIQESPKYDNVFICFGPFHIQMAYFASLGYILDESGILEILADSNILGSGSVNGFVKGKHFNRCKRLHPLLFQAFRHLHLASFLEQKSIPDSVSTLLEELHMNPDVEKLAELENTPEITSFIEEYNNFMDNTRMGCHGTTAQFWILYTDLVQLYLLFSRSCHTNDLDLFTYCIGRMAAVFFATSRQNYARWMLKYYLDLLNIDITHPGVRDVLLKGALTVRRTSKQFSRSPVDLTLEQTINADAASRRGGMIHFTSSLSARRRWIATHSFRSRIVSHTFENAGLQKREDSVQETNTSRIKHDSEDLESLVKGIENSMNPFCSEHNDTKLYCISTGKPTTKQATEDLTSIMKTGEIWLEEFKQECFADSERFEKPIKRRKIQNFTSNGVITQIPLKDKQIRQLRCSRDLFGRLLYLSNTIGLDLQHMFSYPLTPVPLSLAHIDGSMLKTDKSKLLRKLESMTNNLSPASVDTTVVDAMCLIQSLVELPTTYGGIAQVILRRLSSLSPRVDFVTDTYIQPSIKDFERESRGTGLNTKIGGPNQKRPKDFAKALKSASFKTSFLTFLCKEWEKNEYAKYLGHISLYYGILGKCYLYRQEAGEVKCTEVESLACNHEEADTRMIWHLYHINQQNINQNIVIRSSDTDVLVILAFHARNIACSLWMDAGQEGNNNRRYINVSDLAASMGPLLCEALPGLHAFTGCDFTAAFARKGKIRPFEVAIKSNHFMKALGTLGTSVNITDDAFKHLQAFVCSIYGKQNIQRVADARYAIFQTRFSPKSGHLLHRLTGIDQSMLPPSEPVLNQKILRSNYVAFIWKHANTAEPVPCNPIISGWTEQNGQFRPKWFDGLQFPDNINDKLDDLEIANDEDETESTDSEDSDLDI